MVRRPKHWVIGPQFINFFGISIGDISQFKIKFPGCIILTVMRT